jgi:hypothetical protein
MEWTAGAGLLRLFQSSLHAPGAGALVESNPGTGAALFEHRHDPVAFLCSS